MKRHRFLALVAVVLTFATIYGTRDAVRLSAQETGSPTPIPTATATATPLPTPTAYPLQRLTFNLLATAEIELTAGGPSHIRVATIAVAPGMASLPFTNEGPTLLVITSGRLTLESDQAVVSVTDIAFVVGLEPVHGTPGPVTERLVGPGEQVFLPPGSTTSVRNDTSAPATVIIVAVIPVAS